MYNNIDYKYLGHDWKEDFYELERISANYSLRTVYDPTCNVLTVMSEYSCLAFLGLMIWFIISIGFIINLLLKLAIEVGMFEIDFLFLDYFLIINFLLIIGFFVGWIERNSYFNKIEIDFKNKTLKIKNIDFIGKYRFKEKTLSFNSLKKIQAIKIIRGKTKVRFLGVVTKRGVEVPIFALGNSYVNKDVRLIDSFNCILRL